MFVFLTAAMIVLAAGLGFVAWAVHSPAESYATLEEVAAVEAWVGRIGGEEQVEVSGSRLTGRFDGLDWQAELEFTPTALELALSVEVPGARGQEARTRAEQSPDGVTIGDSALEEAFVFAGDGGRWSAVLDGETRGRWTKLSQLGTLKLHEGRLSLRTELARGEAGIEKADKALATMLRVADRLTLPRGSEPVWLERHWQKGDDPAAALAGLRLLGLHGASEQGKRAAVLAHEGDHAVLAALARGDEGAEAGVIGLLEREDADVVEAAIGVLSRGGGPVALPALEGWTGPLAHDAFLAARSIRGRLDPNAGGQLAVVGGGELAVEASEGAVSVAEGGGLAEAPAPRPKERA